MQWVYLEHNERQVNGLAAFLHGTSGQRVSVNMKQAIVLLLWVPLFSMADIHYKCTGSDGSIVHQTYKCGKGQTSMTFNNDYVDPRSMQSGWILRCSPCGPGYSWSWARPDTGQPQSSPPSQSMASSSNQDSSRQNLSASSEAVKSAQEVENAVRVGMGPEQVRAAIGSPASINTSVDSHLGKHEQWVYKGGQFLKDQYVFMLNGKVSSISTSR